METKSEAGLSRRGALKAAGAVALASATVATLPALAGKAAGGFNQIFLDSLVRTADGGMLLRVILTARQGSSDAGNVGTGLPNTSRLGGVGWGEIKVDTIKGPNGEPDWMHNKLTVDSATTAGNAITFEGHVYRARNPVNTGRPFKLIATVGAGEVVPVEFTFGDHLTGYGLLLQSSS
jgi:hypothetical protein